MPLVNGEGQAGFARGEVLAYAATPARLSVAQPKYRDDAKAARTLAIEGDTLVDTATVEATRGPQRLGLALHVQGKARLPAGFAPDAEFAQGRPNSFAHWRDVRGAGFRDRVEFDVDYGNGVVMRVVVTAPGAFTLWQGSSPDVPPKRRESFYLELAEPAASARFITTIAPVKPVASHAPSR